MEIKEIDSKNISQKNILFFAPQFFLQLQTKKSHNIKIQYHLSEAGSGTNRNSTQRIALLLAPDFPRAFAPTRSLCHVDYAFYCFLPDLGRDGRHRNSYKLR
jgi:hypothetical protein